MFKGYKAHLFVCTNGGQNPAKCASKNAEKLRADLKESCRAAFGKDVRVSGSGCMGQCEHGIAAVIYPQNQWFLDCKDTDHDKIFAAVKTAVEET